MDILAPAAFKDLAATCRTSFCECVRIICLSIPSDASQLCSTTWPQLMMVVYTVGIRPEQQAVNSVGFLVEVEAVAKHPKCKCAVLMRPHNKLHGQWQSSLPSQHYTALSTFVYRRRPQMVTLWGPVVRCKPFRPAVQVRHGCQAMVSLHMVNSLQLGVMSMSRVVGKLAITGKPLA